MAAGEERDDRGRFVRGNAGGPGGSRRRACEFRRAAVEAITDKHVAAIMRKATRLALEGDINAMKFVMDRVIGKPAETPTDAEPVDLMLPPLETAADCNKAIDALMTGICSGAVDREAAKLLVTAIQTRLKALETSEIEERLSQFERDTELTRGPRR
jgi:hypothetical protein